MNRDGRLALRRIASVSMAVAFLSLPLAAQSGYQFVKFDVPGAIGNTGHYRDEQIVSHGFLSKAGGKTGGTSAH